MAACFLFLSCRHEQQKTVPLFELMENTGIQFQNTVEDDSLENSFLFRNFYNGAGVGIGDINNDGLPDIFFTSNTGANKLYLNRGNWQFEDITKQAGIISDDKWNTGVAFADVNADGWLDIYVCSSGHMRTGNRKNKLYINDHNLHFTEAADAYGLGIAAYTTQVSFFDYDMDGDLDCFMINNSPIPVNQLNFSNRRDLPEKEWPVGDFLKGGGDHLYRNDGPLVSTQEGVRKGGFTEVTKQAGIHGSLISFGLGVSVGDINGDNYPDVFVSNDSYERDYLYINQKNGTFKDMTEDCMQHVSFSSMGADIADVNNDGYPDLFTTDMLPLNDLRLKTTGAFDNIDLFNAKLKAGFYYQYTQNCLQLNDKNGMFKEIANYSGVAATDWSWGALMLDMDNDGWNDILVCNGVNRDVTNLDFMNFFADEVYHKMVLSGKKQEIDQLLKQIPRNPTPNKIFRNNGNLKFTDMGESWGMAQPSWSNGAAYGDLDNDGDLDLVISNENGPAFIYKNNSRQINHNNYLAFSLKGKDKNPFAVGSKIAVYAGGEIFTKELIPVRGFQSSVDYKLIIGLGKIIAIDSMVVTWPDRSVSTYQKPGINKTILLQWPDGKPVKETAAVPAGNPFFTKVVSNFDKHQEDNAVDFYAERNVPRLLSREGPKAAVADVNGDGLDDVYIGGTPVHGGQLYLQTTDGKFQKKEEPAFIPFTAFEDVAVLFFDDDGDGDADLLVCPGGNTAMPNSRELQLRLFKNDGKGNFTLDDKAFPNVGMNVSIAAANDFNGDGFTDVFIGGRSFPGVYGITPSSYLFQNNGHGYFTDVTKTVAPDIANVGMVCSAVWVDVSGDAKKELVVAGDWMAPRIFTYTGHQFTEVPSNLNSMYGWWQSVTAADLNGDGKPDLVLGNMGENFYTNPDSIRPVMLWVKDFDGNGDPDKILTYTIDGRNMPMFLKKDMEEQMPGIKKGNLKNEVYAGKSVEDLFPGDALKDAVVKKVNYTSSCVAFSKGNGQFTVQKLPPMAQLSCINVVSCTDVNGDGIPDLVTGGNQFGFLPQFERLDASLGDVLINNGKGQFIWQDVVTTGLHMRGEMRDIVTVKGKDRNYYLFLQNADVPVLYELTEKANGGKR